MVGIFLNVFSFLSKYMKNISSQGKVICILNCLPESSDFPKNSFFCLLMFPQHKIELCRDSQRTIIWDCVYARFISKCFTESCLIRLILKVKIAGWVHAGMYTRRFIFLTINPPKICKDYNEQSVRLLESTSNTAISFKWLSDTD